MPNNDLRIQENDRFDFLFINAGRAGSLALQNFLATHPDLVVVPRNGLDDAIVGKISLAMLHEEFMPLIRYCHSVCKKVVLVVRSVQPLWDRDDVLHELSQRVVKCAMVVRNPREFLISGYNVYLATNFGYQFSQLANMPWWGGEDNKILELPLDHDLSTVITPLYPVNLLADIKKFDIDNLSEWGVFRFIQFNKLYLRLLKFFNEIHLFDLSILSNESSVQKIFHFLGVDEQFSSPVFSHTQHGIIQRYMRTNHIVARVFGRETILLRLSTTEDLYYDLDQSPPGPGAEFTEIATMAITEKHRAGFPLKIDSNQISLSAHAWHTVPFYRKRFLENSGELHKTLEFLFMQWIANICEIERNLSPYRVTELSPDLEAELAQIFESDTRHFIALCPDEFGHWAG